MDFISGLIMLCKMMTAIYHLVIVVQTSEVFPTGIRSTLMGIVFGPARYYIINTVSLTHLKQLYIFRVIPALSSYLMFLDLGITYLILMLVNIMSGLLIFISVPETKDKNLPDNMDETLKLFDN